MDDTVRVHARVNVDGLRAGRWYDLPNDDRLADLESMSFVARTGQYGEPAPDTIPAAGCCAER